MNELNDYINESKIVYSNSLDQMKSEFIRSVFDTYEDFYKDTDNTNNNKSSTDLLLKKSESKTQFYNNLENFFKGNEMEKWKNIILKLIKSLKNQPKSFKSIPSSIAKSNNEFLKRDEIPKKGQFRDDIEFNFKNDKYLSFSAKARINTSKLGDIVNDIFSNTDTGDLIKLNDFFTESRLMIVDRYHIDIKGDRSNEPEIKGNIDLKSLEKRADVLVNSRYNYIEKTAVTISKFIISLKKLFKSKKEKEKEKLVSKINNEKLKNLTSSLKSQMMMNGHSSSGNLNINSNNEKFKKIKEIVSFSNFDNLKNKENDTFKITNFKKFLTKTIKEKEEQKEAEIKENLRNKLNKFVAKITNKNNSYEYSDYEESEIEPEESFENEEVYDLKRKPSDINNNDINKKFKKRKTISQNDVNEIVAGNIIEEKVIIPKKKVNFLGLKMFLKETIEKNKKLK